MSTKEACTEEVGEEVLEELWDRVGDEVWSDGPGEDVNESSTDSPTPPFTTSIYDLPREVMLEVFSYFSVKELCCQLSLVCQEWYSLAHDPILWQRLYLVHSHPSRVDAEDSPYSRYALHELLSRVPLLKSLIVHVRTDASEILRVIGLSCPQLQKLEVRFCKNLKEEDIKGVICGCPSICHLSLEGSALPLTSPSSYQLITRLNKLKVLNLSHCKTLDSESLRFLADNLPSLQELNIDDVINLTDEDLIYVIDKKKTMLTKLLIDGEGLSDTVYRACAKCRKLISFGVSFADGMTNEGFNEIATLDNLIWMKIKKAVSVSSKSFVCLFKKASAHKLMHVDLSECTGVDDEVLMTVAENCPLLQCLAIRWCWEVTDSGIGYLITMCTKLESLDLLGVVRITNRAIETIPEHLKNLTYLNLEQCNFVNNDVITEVVCRLPNLLAVDYYGERVVKVDSSSDSDSD